MLSNILLWFRGLDISSNTKRRKKRQVENVMLVLLKKIYYNICLPGLSYFFVVCADKY